MRLNEKCVNLRRKPDKHMSLENLLNEDMKSALKAGEKKKLETIRTLRAVLKDERIKKGDDLTEEEVVAVLVSAAKKRRESIEMYRNGQRDDLVAAESEELEIITKYLPEQLGEDKIKSLIDEVISATGATAMKDMGKVMGSLMPKVKGRADGKLVQSLVKDALSKPGG